LDDHRPKAVDLGAARLGKSMAAPQWTTLGLQEIRRAFRQRWLTQVAFTEDKYRAFALAVSKIQARLGLAVQTLTASSSAPTSERLEVHEGGNNRY
jgi:hypothetical protein